MAAALIGLVVLAGCGGNGEEPGPGGIEPGPEGPVATATPLAQLPETTIVSGSDTGSGATPGDDAGATEDAVTYTVEPGDSLMAIADRFGVSTEAIQEANDLTGTDIFVGDQLAIPRAGADGDEPADPPDGEAGANGDEPPPTDGDVYTVESGDTPLGIALMFDISLEDLEEANGGPGSLDALQVDQEIVIPQ